MTQPTISLLFPLYKSKQFLDNLTTHLDRFTNATTQVIVSDRHGFDDTIDVLRNRYEDRPHFMFLSATDGVGWVDHFNALIATSSGRYFSFVFHDDRYPADYFDVLAEELELHPSAIMSFGHMHATGDTTWVIDSAIFREPHPFPYSTARYIKLLYSNLLGIAFRGVFRSAPIKREGLFIRSNDKVSMFEDYYWIFALLQRGAFAFTDRTSCIKVFRQGGASGAWDYEKFFKTHSAARSMLYRYTLASPLPAVTKAGICAGVAGRALKNSAMRASRMIRRVRLGGPSVGRPGSEA